MRGFDAHLAQAIEVCAWASGPDGRESEDTVTRRRGEPFILDSGFWIRDGEGAVRTWVAQMVQDIGYTSVGSR